jgi:hypothetical protein
MRRFPTDPKRQPPAVDDDEREAPHRPSDKMLRRPSDKARRRPQDK